MAFDFTGKTILAPMAGVTDLTMRSLCLQQGADLAFTEMVSTKGLSYANDKTRHLLDVGENEQLVAVQLFGHEPDTMASQARYVEEHMGDTLAYIDINMGCPARKIVTKGDGSALMKTPDLAAHIVSAVKESVSVPVTCKFRRGWHEGDETAPAFAKLMEQAGADALTVHGRFAEQFYRGTSDRGAIRRVKQAVSIPVIGNGDIMSGADACDLYAQTGCDSIMVARGAQGNPWIFAEIKAALAGDDTYRPPSALERINMAEKHAALLSAREGRNIVRMRKHACWYVAGLPGAAKARDRINHCTDFEDFKSVFDEMRHYAARSL